MPELPEVETTKRGIEPYLVGRRIVDVVVRETRLRYPIPGSFKQDVIGRDIVRLVRRGKYIIVESDQGGLIFHLGMSGSLRIVGGDEIAKKHDHVDLILDSGLSLRFHDPRRFGAILWEAGDPAEHNLIRHLGVEPLEDEFNGDVLYARSRRSKRPVKTFIMDAQVVVGVGNIYANEALFAARIHPLREAGRISRKRYQCLAEVVKVVLARAIEQGGTTLRDFVNGHGDPGYFQQSLDVYGRNGQPCVVCGKVIEMLRVTQRSTYFCSRCQR